MIYIYIYNDIYNIYTYNEDIIYIYMYTYIYIYSGYSVVNGGTVRGIGIRIPNKIGELRSY